MLQQAGAELIVLCTNTMHRVADVIEEALDVPFIHIADTTALAIKRSGLGRVAPLGTRYTMEQDFYRGRLEQRHGIDVIVPGEADRGLIHDVIYRELVRGIVREESRTAYLDIIRRLVAEGAEGVVAGCTEIELLCESVGAVHRDRCQATTLAPRHDPQRIRYQQWLPW